MSRTWLITEICSGFVLNMTKQLLEKGECVQGGVRDFDDVSGLMEQYPGALNCHILDMQDDEGIQSFVDIAFEKHGHIDVIVSSIGYDCIDTLKESHDEEVNVNAVTSDTGAIKLMQAVLPYLKKQENGHVILVSPCGEQVPYPSDSLYHATKFEIEGDCKVLAQEVKQFRIGVTMIKPYGASKQCRFNSEKMSFLLDAYKSCHKFLSMLDPSKHFVSGVLEKTVQQKKNREDMTSIPLRFILGSSLLDTAIERWGDKFCDDLNQKEIARYFDMTTNDNKHFHENRL